MEVLIAGLALIFGIYQYYQNRKLQEKQLAIEKDNKELQKSLLTLEERKTEVDEIKVKQESEKKQEVLQQQIEDLSEYERYMFNKFRYLDFTGLSKYKKIPLEKIYVKLKMQPALKRNLYQSIDDFKALKEEQVANESPIQSISEVLKNARHKTLQQQETCRLLIVGHPGSGKTTLMKWIALQCLLKNSFYQKYTPIFLPLKDLSTQPIATFTQTNLLELIATTIKNSNCSSDFLQEAFKEGKLLFLLDGLDEIAAVEKRKAVIKWIEKQRLGDNSLVITSRFSGLDEAKNVHFRKIDAVFTIQDFDKEDIAAFLKNWSHHVVATLNPTFSEQEITTEANKDYKDLQETLDNPAYARLLTLAVNPLMLTMIAIVHRTKGRLPLYRHKLYEEMLEVMLERWYERNKDLKVHFSLDTSRNNLAKIAVFLMKDNRRELTFKELKKQLPNALTEENKEAFIDEIVLKSNLLYESEGEYGFLHLTFQEYLAAYYYAKSENPLAILQHRAKDYWTETFKLFTNISNTQQFFDKIIHNLTEESYWSKMNLWEACLQDIPEDDPQQKLGKENLEKALAQTILPILQTIPYEEKEDKKIIQLFPYYGLYKYAQEFEKEAWQLFKNAPHPFIQSVGSSILNRSTAATQNQLFQHLKKQLQVFEQQQDKSTKALVHFALQHNNSFILLWVRRKRISDFIFCLTMLKSKESFMVFLSFRTLIDFRGFIGFIGFRDLIDLRALIDLIDLIDLRTFRAFIDLIDFIGFRDLIDFRYLEESYTAKYKVILQNNQQLIHQKAAEAFQKLQALPNEQIRHYFPNTTPAELIAFRDMDELAILAVAE